MKEQTSTEILTETLAGLRAKFVDAEGTASASIAREIRVIVGELDELARDQHVSAIDELQGRRRA